MSGLFPPCPPVKQEKEEQEKKGKLVFVFFCFFSGKNLHSYNTTSLSPLSFVVVVVVYHCPRRALALDLLETIERK
jgi:hypothetical protein